ncbi:MAG: TerB family tellurite resistance protein, partial [Rhizobiales bacterium]|nr:TerB family tellurite resistance protein [Hyphomicrobiales bacterium]
PPSRFEDNDYRVAAAALLIHITAIDGEVTNDERHVVHDTLKRQFDLDEAATAELIAAATDAEGEAVDLYRFASLLNRSLDDKGRGRIVEMMWKIVYADGRVSEFEDNVVWRAADLLGVAARDRIGLRQRVSGNRSGTDGNT